jgi:DNA-binding CsgD family transcriptional regulator
MLTNQETKVANLIGVGYSDKETADILHVSTRTVVNHKQNIFEKLNINKATELVIWIWCQKAKIDFDLTEIRKQVTAIILLVLLVPGIANIDVKPRVRRGNIGRTRTTFSITK